MIFYFSGTGNSRHVANTMTDENKINIAEAAKQNKYSYQLAAGESVGFVMPVYYSGIPKPVLEFVRKLELIGKTEYLYIILTHGGGAGAAGTMLRKELKKKGYPLHACFDVKMTSNYIMFGDIRPDETIHKELAAAASKIAEIKEHVDKKDPVLPNWSFISVAATASMKCLCDNYMSVKKFHADDGCTGCGACAKSCPSSLIKMVDGKPQWTENRCVRCMACLKCSHVQFSSKSKQRRRYSFERYK